MPEGKAKDRSEIIERVCPLPENKHILDRFEKETGNACDLNLLLANRDRLSTCPVMSLDYWALEMWEDYNLRKAFSDMQNLHQLTHKAFRIILIEQLKCDRFAEEDRERQAKADEIKAKRGF